jgi:hypothetical protein
MPKTLLVVVLLLTAVAALAATPDSNTQPATATQAIKAYLMPDLSFRSVFALDSLQPSEALDVQPDSFGVPPRKRGTCRCSCGFPCSTDADCGGATCDAFITCCARKPQTPEIGWFTRSFEFSSHKTPPHAAILKEIFKTECK